MSYHAFLASDYPLDNIENHHAKLLSVNQAVKIGISESSLLLNIGINRDEPNAILWVDNEEHLGEITIHATEKSFWMNKRYPIPTTMKFCSSLEWEYTEERAKCLIIYIKKHLEISDSIEIWRIWDGVIENTSSCKQLRIPKTILSPNYFKEMFFSNEINEYSIIIVQE